MKNLSIFKNDKKTSENQPDYRLVASYQDAAGNWENVTVASLWKGDKDKPNGPVLKGKMSEERSFEGKTYPGYSIKPDATERPPEPDENWREGTGAAPIQSEADTIRNQEPEDLPF